MKLFFPRWRIAVLCYALLWAGLVVLTWLHGYSYLAGHKNIVDIQYTDTTLSFFYFFLLALTCVFYLFLTLIPWQSLSWKTCMGLALLFALFSSCSLPVNSGDFFSYIEFARLIVIYGLSPYLHGYQEIHDAYSSFSWFGKTSNYSPLAPLPAMPAAWASEFSAYAGFVVLKLTWLLIATAVLFLLKKSLEKESNGKNWFMLFALNPLWLLEVFINGHNDIVGIFLLVVVLSLIVKRRFYWLSMFAAVLPLFKTPLGAVAAFLAFWFFRIKNYKSFLVVGISTLVAIGLLLACIGDLTAIHWFLVQSAPLSVNSFVGRFAWLYQTFFLTAESQAIWSQIVPFISPVCALGILATLLYQALRRGHTVNNSKVTAHASDGKKSPVLPLQELGFCLWALVFIFATQFWPWYGLWLLPFMAFIQKRSFFWLALVSSFGGLMMYSPFFWQILATGEKNVDAGSAVYIFLPTFAAGLAWYLYRRLEKSSVPSK